LVLLLVLIGALFWPSENGEQEEVFARKANSSAEMPSALTH
jgi:hypothetical protein